MEAIQRTDYNQPCVVKIKGMWSNNTGEAKIEADQVTFLKILNAHENIDTTVYLSKLRQVKEPKDMTSR